MIPRTLVPLKISRVDPNAPPENGARRTSQLDSRIVVPSGPSTAPLDTRTSIPLHLPLDVLSSRILIPRDMPVKQMEPSATAIPSHVPMAVLETRVVVPQEAVLEESFHPTVQAPLPAGVFDDIIERDLFNTGEINLLASPEDPKKAGLGLAGAVVFVACARGSDSADFVRAEAFHFECSGATGGDGSGAIVACVSSAVG